MRTLTTAGLIVVRDRKPLLEQPTPAAEIGGLRYFNTYSYSDQPQQVPGVVTVMSRLQADGLID